MNHLSAQDHQLIKQLETFEIRAGEFSHRSHICLAYAYLCNNRLEATIDLIRKALCQFLSHNGIEPSTKYHETMTRAWTQIVYRCMNETPNTESSDEFLAQNPELLDSSLMMRYYSKDLLFSDAAREEFVEPDIRPLDCSCD